MAGILKQPKIDKLLEDLADNTEIEEVETPKLDKVEAKRLFLESVAGYIPDGSDTFIVDSNDVRNFTCLIVNKDFISVSVLHKSSGKIVFHCLYNLKGLLSYKLFDRSIYLYVGTYDKSVEICGLSLNQTDAISISCTLSSYIGIERKLMKCS